MARRLDPDADSSSAPFQALAQRLQVLVSLATPGTLEDFVSSLKFLAGQLPSPNNFAEECVLHRLLVELVHNTESRFGALSVWLVPVDDIRGVASNFQHWSALIGTPLPNVCMHPRVDWLDHVMRILQRESDTPLTVRSLARRIGRNPSYLSTKFRQEYGVTLRQCLIRARISNAVRLLQQGVKPEAAGILAGYRSKAEFYRTFRRCVGCTPGEFRNRQRPK